MSRKVELPLDLTLTLTGAVGHTYIYILAMQDITLNIYTISYMHLLMSSNLVPFLEKVKFIGLTCCESTDGSVLILAQPIT